MIASCDGQLEFASYLIRIPGRFNVFTAGDGRFEIDGVPPGTHAVSVELLSGFVNSFNQVRSAPASFGFSQNVTVDPAINGGVVDVQFDLNVPSCAPIQCPGTPACSSNGTCDTRVGACTCAPGFAGPDCSLPILGPGTVCSINEQCSSGICGAGFCQASRDTCVFYSGPTPTISPDGAACAGVPGLGFQHDFGLCFEAKCRATACSGNSITLLEYFGGPPVNYSLSCDPKACVFDGTKAICTP